MRISRRREAPPTSDMTSLGALLWNHYRVGSGDWADCEINYREFERMTGVSRATVAGYQNPVTDDWVRPWPATLRLIAEGLSEGLKTKVDVAWLQAAVDSDARYAPDSDAVDEIIRHPERLTDDQLDRLEAALARDRERRK